jgi:hypothetical protein
MISDSTVQGYPPEMAVSSGNPEAQKYGRMWELPEYRMSSPGAFFVPRFLTQARPKAASHVIDFGCGTGRAGLAMYKAGMTVSMLDFTRNCLDASVRDSLGENLTFIKHDLVYPAPVVAEYGFCSDVMEHIPEGQVDKVLENILRAAQHCFFAVSTADDICGELIGETLHVTVHDFAWWLDRFKAMDCIVHWSDTVGSYAFFYVTAWQDAKVVVDTGEVNTEVEQIRANVRFNSARGWQQITPHETNDVDIILLGGGPSLNEHEDDIRALQKQGCKIVTLNGAYNWALDRCITPVNQIMVDARPFNARFVQPVRDDCLYFIGSQCDPSVFEGLPRDRTYIWHAVANPINDILDEAYDVWWPVPGGSTVLLRAIPLLRMLGFRRFHLFGCDSCIQDGRHHSFAQQENDGEVIVPITVTGGRVFYCYPWMVSQAQEFMGLVRDLGDVIDIEIHGDGLLKHIVEIGAEITETMEV